MSILHIDLLIAHASLSGVYTAEEEKYNQRTPIIGPDVQIPNSTVRRRLHTSQTSMQAQLESLRKVFDLPDELLLNLSKERHLDRTSMEDEQLSFNWNDIDDDTDVKHKKSPTDIIIEKQREKRRKHEDYNYDYDTMQALPLNEIIEEIRTNVGKDLNAEEIKAITALMEIIGRHRPDQVMNIYEEFAEVRLIRQFGGVPKLVQVSTRERAAHTDRGLPVGSARDTTSVRTSCHENEPCLD